VNSRDVVIHGVAAFICRWLLLLPADSASNLLPLSQCRTMVRYCSITEFAPLLDEDKVGTDPGGVPGGVG